MAFCRRVRPGLRLLLVLMGCTLCVAELAAAELRPLLDRAVDQGRVLSALSALTRGDAGPLVALDAEAFLAEVGVTDPSDPRLVRRWTELLPTALKPLDETARDTALTALTTRFSILTSSFDDHDERRLALALAFLPAPSAAAIVADAADHAFDRGQFRTYRAWAAHLPDERRRHVADLLGGFGPVIDPALALHEPGPLIATAAPAPIQPPGIAVRWQVVDGWLLAGDPLGRVRWQYRCERDAIVVPGDGGAVIVEQSGVRFLNEQGTATDLPPLPAGGRALAVAGGAAWFQVGTRIHRWAPTDGLATLDLGAEPISAPLVRGTDSLWLTATELVLVRDGTVTARYRHDRPVDARWRLTLDEATPMLVDPTGQAERVSDLASALVALDPVAALAHLLRAGRSAEVIARVAADPTLAADPATRPLLVRAHLLARSPDLDAVLALADQPAEQALVLTWAARMAGEPWSQRLWEWASDHPDQILAPQLDDPLAEPMEASWRVRASAWAAAVPLLASATVGPARPWIGAEPIPRRRDNGTWHLGDRIWTMTSDLERTVLSCHDAHGERWQHWWPTPDVLIAPSRQFRVTPTAILVIEGNRTLRLFDPADGRGRGELALLGRDLAVGDVIVLGDGHIAALQPAWLHTALHRLDAEGWEVTPLPSRGRWAVALGDHTVVVHDQHEPTSIPAGATLPADLHVGEPPVPLAEGLYRAGSLWPWSTGAGPGQTPTTTSGSDAR